MDDEARIHFELEALYRAVRCLFFKFFLIREDRRLPHARTPEKGDEAE